jgi:hypothetical protein
MVGSPTTDLCALAKDFADLIPALEETLIVIIQEGQQMLQLPHLVERI